MWYGVSRHEDMKRFLFNSFSILSLALCLITAALWGRSQFVTYSAGRGWSHFGLEAETFRGAISLLYVTDESKPDQHWNVDASPPESVDDEAAGRMFPFHHHFAGFVIVAGPVYGARVMDLAVPFWFIILMLLILPAIRLRTALRERRHRKRGHCESCGYDLRASLDRCPECGTAFAKV